MKLHLERDHTLTKPCEKEHVYLCSDCGKPFITSGELFLAPLGGQWGADRYPFWPYCSLACASIPSNAHNRALFSPTYGEDRVAMFEPEALRAWPGPIYFDIATYTPPTVAVETPIQDILLPGRRK